MTAVVGDDWAGLWERHRPPLVRHLCTLLGGDEHAAEDIAQETALRFWTHRDVLRADEPIGPWLRTVARNVLVDRHRRRAARPPEVPLTAAADPSDATEPTAGVEAALTVAALLTGLPAAQRDAVLYVHVSGLSVAQAADRLGIPPGTVKSRCHHALRRLREPFARTPRRPAPAAARGVPGSWRPPA